MYNIYRFCVIYIYIYCLIFYLFFGVGALLNYSKSFSSFKKIFFFFLRFWNAQDNIWATEGCTTHSVTNREDGSVTLECVNILYMLVCIYNRAIKKIIRNADLKKKSSLTLLVLETICVCLFCSFCCNLLCVCVCFVLFFFRILPLMHLKKKKQKLQPGYLLLQF